ncbi:uncharacterized protein LOC143297311 [Babylonia areolata]|uniref:uncharacterized protein LOC143297311 n=1 Tax=Babylonia areolata TaxID=304850 RepID=UPI003FD11C17
MTENMDEIAFENWMGDVMPQMIQLSLKQTETLFEQFVLNCSRDQKRFLEKQISLFLRRDFFTLPDLVVEHILGYLNIPTLLNLRLVCQSWDRRLRAMGRMWNSRCQQQSVLPYTRPSQSAKSSFEHFMRSRRVLHLLKANKALSMVYRPVFLWWPGSKIMCSGASFHEDSFHYRLVPHIVEYSHHHQMIVTGCKSNVHLMAMHARSNLPLWVSKDFMPTCLLFSSDLLLAGNHFGQVRVLTLTGEALHKDFQCGPCSVTALDVHPDGHFMIVATTDGDLHLVDDSLDVFNMGSIVSIQIDDVENYSVSDLVPTKVFFLPDGGLKKDQVAVCVCTGHWICAAVLSSTGRLLQKDVHIFPISAFSFCRSSAQPNVVYTSSGKYVQHGRTFTEHTFKVSSKGVVSQQVQERVISESWSLFSNVDKENILLLAAGEKLGVAAIDNSVYVFNLACGTVMYKNKTFLHGQTVKRLALNKETGRVCVVSTEWLDGLSPQSMQGEDPVMLFTVPSVLGTVGHQGIASLFWSPSLLKAWNIVPEQRTQHHGTAHSSSAGGDGRSDDSHAFILGSKEMEDDDDDDDDDAHDHTGMRDDGEHHSTDPLLQYRTSQSLGVWRNAALFQQKMKDVKSGSADLSGLWLPP